MIVGTAGHIDHGKTSLVRALTGIDTDRLKEEKARGITIDLGFAYMVAPDGKSIGFVDVPGHERLVRTMVAGATGIDFALLVVAGDDGVMPQTREHLDILDLLHLPRGLIAITKCDRIDAARRKIVAAEVAAAVRSTSMAGADILFVSATTGEGIERLRDILVREVLKPPARQKAAVFRLSVDRVFTLNGVGTVVTGTACAGRVRVGDEVTLLPGRLKARVRSLHAHNAAAREGAAGERCALALSGVGISKDSVARGAWICGDSDPLETGRFDADITLLKSGTRSFAQWTPVHLHCGASDVGAHVTVLSDVPMAAGGCGPVQIVLDRPLPLRHGDRFILRDQSARQTLGGGVVLDPRASIRKRRAPDRLARLDARRTSDPAEALGGLLALDPGFEDFEAFAADRGLEATQRDELRIGLELSSLPVGEATYVYTASRWSHFADGVVAFLRSYHADNPELPGVAGERLRLALMSQVPKPLFAVIRDRLAAEKRIVVVGHLLRLPDHVAQLSADERRLGQLMIPLIAKQRFRPPRVRDLSAVLALQETHVRRACKALARTGAFMEIAPDQFFLRETVVEMARIARDLSRNSATSHFTAADFRDRMDNGRKVAIQILECFDRQGLTRREGDLRRVVKEPELIFGTSRDMPEGALGPAP